MKNLITVIYVWLMYSLDLKYEVESKPYRKIIYQYFRWKDWNYETTITYVKTFKKGDTTIIEIETHRPGLLIGKAGVFIDGLQQELWERTKENIKIDLKECKLWHNLFR